MKEQKIKIAIVDDHQIILDGLIALLKEHPIIEITATANEGEKMLQLLQNKAVDILLTDVMMPGMDGPTTLAKLRETPTTRIIPVIFFSAKMNSPELAKLATLEVAGYLKKPFDPLRLAPDIARLLGWPPVGSG